MLIYQSFRVLFHINCTDFAKSLGSGFAAGGSTRRSQASSGGFFFQVTFFRVYMVFFQNH